MGEKLVMFIRILNIKDKNYMRKSKEFFGVLLGVLVCVFLVFLGVYATTTVGDDITVGDDLVVTGLASVAETFRVPLIYGNTDTGGYLRIGDQALTSHSLDANDDLLVTGELEVDGTVYFDGNVSLSDSSVLYTTDIIGVRDAGLYLIIGDEALTSHSLAANDDLLVSGKLEVDGLAYFDGAASVSSGDLSVESGNFSVDGTASVSGGLLVGSGATIYGGTVSATGALIPCTVGSIYLRTGVASAGAALSICDATDTWTPFAEINFGY